MKPSIFRTLIDYEHRKWLGESLGLSSFTYNGIDLIDNKFGVEIKSRYREYSLNFAVHIYQFEISDVKTGPYIYVGKRNFPDNNYFNKFEKGNGIIYLPKNSVLESRLNLNI